MSSPWSNQLVSLLIIAEPLGQFAGIFVYSPSPGPGNLIGSWAAQSGVDPYGNAYPQGLNVTVGSISGTTFNGTNFTLNSNGLFLYSGTPAAGNLLVSATTATGTDPFGNSYLQGLTSYGQPMAGTWIAANFNISASAFGVLYFTATSEAGPWSIDSWLRRSGSSAGQIEVGPILELLGTALSPATPASGSKLWTPSAGTNANYMRILKPDGTAYGIGEVTNELPVDQTISAAWAVPIAGGGVNLSFAVQSGTQYRWWVTIRAITTAAGTLDLGVTGPATSQSNWWFLGSTSPTQSPQTALTFVAPNLAGATDYTASFWGTFTPSANGTFSVGAGTGTAGNFTVKNGSFVTLRSVI